MSGLRVTVVAACSEAFPFNEIQEAKELLMSLSNLSKNMWIGDDWKKKEHDFFSLGTVEEGIVPSLSYQGIEGDRRKGSALYHPEGKKKNQRLRSYLHRTKGITIIIVT